MQKIVFGIVCLVACAYSVLAVCNFNVSYTSTFVPDCTGNTMQIKYPNYENETEYYYCNGYNNPVKFQCAEGQYFSYVMQKCGDCDSYLPAVACENLRGIKPNCQPIVQKTTTVAPTTVANNTTVAANTTVAETSAAPTTVVSTTDVPTTAAPTDATPTTAAPTTAAPTTAAPTTAAPTTAAPTTAAPTTAAPTTAAPTTAAPTTAAPTTAAPVTPTAAA